MDKLEQLLEREAHELDQEFQKASEAGEGTPQEIAEFRENALRAFLTRFFPYPYRVTKGKIVDTFQSISSSIDCVILNPVHPHTVDSQDKFRLILADGVDCAIELKPDITDINELHRGLEQVRSVKKLKRGESPVLLKPQQSKALIEHSLRIPTIIFAAKAKDDISKIVDDIAAYYQQHSVPTAEQFDFVVINRTGILTNVKLAELNRFPPPPPIPQTGFFFEEWGVNTLAGMILHINASFPAEPRMSTPVLTRFLKHISPKSWHRYQRDTGSTD